MNRSAIPYLTHVWNPTTGCSPMSAGCAGCWAAAYHRRWRKSFVPTFHSEKLNEPMRLRKPAVIGVSFMGDLFHDDLDDMDPRAVLLTAADCKRHTFVVLTKRAEKMRRLMVNLDTVAAAENVWIGVSVEDQATAEERIPILLDTPAAHRWVSLEPQIGPVDLSRWLRVGWRCSWCGGYFGGKWQKVCPQCGKEDYWTGSHKFNSHNGFIPSQHGRAIDLVIQGCESGSRRRFFASTWARSMRDQCAAAVVPYYLKQMPDSCCVFQGPFNGRGVHEKPALDGRQHLDLPWEVKP